MKRSKVFSERREEKRTHSNLERFSWSALIEGVNDLVIDISELLQGLLEEEDVAAVFSLGHSLQFNVFEKLIIYL